MAGIPQRSGTTAFAEYLNLHPEILICIERYRYRPRPLTPELFTFDRILDYRDGETTVPRERHVELLANKDPELLRWVGEKQPKLFKSYATLLRDNPGARFIVMYRPIEEVAASFKARARNPRDRWSADAGPKEAVRRWNLALNETRNFVEGVLQPSLLIIPYRPFFRQDPVCLSRLAQFLEVDFDQELLDEWRRKSLKFSRKPQRERLDETEAQYIRETKDADAERWVSDYLDLQYR